jgi:tetratricopeptide (TPR) repeat protein
MAASDDILPSDAAALSASQWREMVRHEEKRGELLAAYDAARRGLEEYPDDVELAYRAVLALARTGATYEAERRFNELGLSKIDTEDVCALGARIQKDRALATTGSEGQQLAAVAASSYKRISDRNQSYFPAINAATLSLVSGDPEGARALAAEALASVETSGDESYYAVATRAEARLLLGDPSAARHELERAAQRHEGDFGALSTTRRQLRMICTITGIDPALLSVLAGPAVAHFCGHMIGGDGPGPLRSFDEAHAAGQIAEVIRRQPVGFAYGSLASGADILWAEALLGAGAELHVVLPCAIEDFLSASVAPSGPQWLERFQKCLEAAVSVTYATEGRFLGDSSLFRYCAELAMGLALLRARFLDADAFQLALWDGAQPSGTVGTAVDVATWRRTGRDVVTVAPIILADGDHRPKASNAPEPGGRVVRAILIGDMSDFSKLPDEQLPAFSGLVMSCLARVLNRYGAEVEYRNTWGDALIAVISNAQSAARCALDLQDAMDGIDLKAAGLPTHLALRLSGHVGPVFPILDPVLGLPSFMGSHISRTARIEPVTPPGEVYVTEAFAASLELAGSNDLGCNYVGHMPAAKNYGRLRMYHLIRRGQVDASRERGST